MITQDLYWRKDLIKFGERLERRYRQDKWSNRIEYSVEKDVFLSFYIIRKLIERDRIEGGIVNPQLLQEQYNVTMHPNVGRVQPLNSPKTFARNFQLFKTPIEKLKLEDICNQFIHSFIFSPFVPSGNTMVGIFFASDRQCGKDSLKLSERDFLKLPSFITKLKQSTDTMSVYIQNSLSDTTRRELLNWQDSKPVSQKAQKGLVQDLNKLIDGELDKTRFVGVALRLETKQLMAQNPQDQDSARLLNRMVLEDAYPLELRKRGAYYIPLVKVIEIIIAVGKNKPVKLKVARKAGTFKVDIERAICSP